MKGASIRTYPLRTLALLLALAGIATTANLRVALKPANERKPAPQFALKDSSGKTIELKDYQGKVVLVDFWATWCTGCKMEIPWFSEFQKTYGAKGFVAIGVSMDEGGWSVLRPFLTKTLIPYPVLLGDGPTAHRFGIQGMPDTFLIDRQGRLAAAYLTGLVDKDNIEGNIKSLLAQP